VKAIGEFFLTLFEMIMGCIAIILAFVFAAFIGINLGKVVSSILQFFEV
jgi:hypothetical protein